MGVSVPLPRVLIGLCVLVIGAGGLRVIDMGEEEDCSQPGIQCSIKSSSCWDFSWFRRFIWTPTAPDTMTVTAVIGKNEMGQTVPVLQINWTIGIDGSILQLQGAEIYVVEISTNANRCVQFQFNGTFPSQLNQDGQPWQFSFDKFAVIPGHEYLVTIQHLPKHQENFKELKFIVPRCHEGNMRLTSTCCDLGLCWFPDIGINNNGENLTVEFTSRWDAQEYGVNVKVGMLSKYERVIIPEGSPIQRRQVTFPDIGVYIDKPCKYNISVWPYMSSCANNCIRQFYVPPCNTITPPPPDEPTEVAERWYLWSVAVLVTVVLCGSIILVLFIKDCKYTETKTNLIIDCDQPNPLPPSPKKVWLVYSADHKYYIKVVIRLVDFMRVAWGLDVVLDRFHVQEMSISNPMVWLDRQKKEIEKTNGTILILCSRGVQEKWKAMQYVKEQKKSLKEDRKHPIGDLFTPALSLILPDFQKAKPYDRYVVAYFGSISSLADIPGPFESPSNYSLTENLQDIYFRIQRQERHQPNKEINISYENNPSYEYLVEEIQRCKEWQDKNPDWYEKECCLNPAEDLDVSEEEEEVDENVTRKLKPMIRWPETSVSVLKPLIVKPDPVTVLDPTIMLGTPSTHVEPFLSDAGASMSVVQPLLKDVIQPAVYIQEPRLVGGDPSIKGLRHDVSIQYDHGALSVEQLREAQESFFLNGLDNRDSMDYPSQEMRFPILDVIVDQPLRVGEQFQEVFQNGQIMTPAVDQGGHSAQLADQGYSTWNSQEMDLKAIQMASLKLLLQNGGVY